MKLAAHIIGARRIEAREDTGHKRFCPGDTRQLVSISPLSDEATVKEAVVAAKLAFPEWSRKTPMDRARVVGKALDLMRSRSSEIAALMRLEAGKPIHEAIGEVAKGLQALEWAIGIAGRMGGVTRVGEGGAVQLTTKRCALGPVALITPWNFPFAVPLWKIGPSIVTGNTVVLKGSEWTLGVTTLIGEIFLEAGLPPGVLNIVHGGREVVEPLVIHPDIKAVSFTGSTPVGRHLVKHMGLHRDHPIPYQAELGGNNALYVSEFADVPLAVAAVMASKFGSTGQRCTALQRAIVHRKVWLEFYHQLKMALDQIQIGLSDDPSVKTMGPVVNDEQLLRLQQLATVLDHGDESIWNGDRLVSLDHEHGHFMIPTVILNTSPQSRLWKNEIFGPILVVRTVDSFDEAVDAINDSEFGFVAAIFSENRRELEQFVDGRVEAAMLHTNEGTAGGEFPVEFGGWKATGIGLREMGDEGWLFYTRGQTIFTSSATTGSKVDIR